MDKESKRWIEAKGRELTVKILEAKACCAPGVQEVIAVPGKPKKTEYFNQVNYEDLSIYVQKPLSGKEKLTLKLSGFSILKSLSAKIE
jgi:hypothetical protein